MLDAVHARILRQALEIVGGAEQLARYLKTSPADLQLWLVGDDIPRAQTFFVLLDIVARRVQTRDRAGRGNDCASALGLEN